MRQSRQRTSAVLIFVAVLGSQVPAHRVAGFTQGGRLLPAATPVISVAAPECARWRTAFADMPVRQVTVESIDLRVKVADTPERQAAGFQCATRKEILRTLIMFDFGAEILSQFHMQNVPAPLDIAFARGDGGIFAILHMEPSPTALYGPPGPFRYALEARAGFFSTEGIGAGTSRLITKE